MNEAVTFTSSEFGINVKLDLRMLVKATKP
jgi:hypothetical protein